MNILTADSNGRQQRPHFPFLSPAEPEGQQLDMRFMGREGRRRFKKTLALSANTGSTLLLGSGCLHTFDELGHQL